MERVFYVPATGYNRIRSGKCHVKSWESEESPEGCLISVRATTVTRVLLRNTGPKMVVAQPDTQSFWEFLDSVGREWMLESVGCGKGLEWTWQEALGINRPDARTWLVDGTNNNTITWCTDGSYHRKPAPEVSGAGWMACCTKTNNNMTGSFYEISEDAGSYRGKQLGLCTIHHLIKALCNFYKIHDWHTTINCDNVGAIKMSKGNLNRIRTGCSCANILRNLRNTRKR